MKKICSIIALIASALHVGCAAEDKYKTLDNKEFAELLAEGSVQLVDVRTAEEYAGGFIPGAVNIDVRAESFADECDALDPARPVAVYCRSGVRSRTAAEILVGKGFTVYNLKGGILGWDGPTETPVAEAAGPPADKTGSADEKGSDSPSENGTAVDL